MESCYYGLSILDLRSLAFQFAEMNHVEHPFHKEKQLAGEDWVKGFMRRHPKLAVRKPEATSLARASAFNRVNVGKFFDLLKKAREEGNISPHRIFNVDETGITTVQAKASRIIARKGKHQVGAVTSAERGILSTAVICTSASGQYIPPMLIFPRVRKKAELEDGTPPATLVECHPSGWMQTSLFTAWFQHFLKHAKPSCEDPVLLILDGHSTHTRNLEVIEMARVNHVTMLVLPPHSTHRLQPLDVAFMGPLSTFYSKEIEKYLLNHPGRAITQFQVGALFGAAYLRAATPSNAINGFRKCGIVPYDPELFGDADFAAASVTDVAEATEPPELKDKPIQQLEEGSEGEDKGRGSEGEKDKGLQIGEPGDEGTTQKTVGGGTTAVAHSPEKSSEGGDKGKSSEEEKDKSLQLGEPGDEGTTQNAAGGTTAVAHSPEKGSEGGDKSKSPAEEKDKGLQLGELGDEVTTQNAAEGGTNVLAHSPADIRPLPKIQVPVKRRKGKKGSTMIITGSPYKAELQQQLSKKCEPNKKQSKVSGKKPSEKEKCEPNKKQSKVSGKKPSEKEKKKYPVRSKKAVKRKLIENDEEDEADETTCLYCDEKYGDSRRGEGWVLCLGRCKRWAHEQCAGVDTDEEYTCEICED